MTTPATFPPGSLLHFVRHGATAANLAGLRCGGDLDLPLTETGRRQAQQAGQALLALQPANGHIAHIVTSDLQRTRETAALIAGVLGSSWALPALWVEPAFAERRLGDWNLKPLAETEAALRAGQVPPGGESDAEFQHRIRGALARIAPLLGQPVLLVGSKGVARVLGLLCGVPHRLALDNGALFRFDLGLAPPVPPRTPANLETP